MTIWFTARGAGLATLVMFSAATCLGALVSRDGIGARRGRPAARYIAQYVHRACAGLGVGLLALHITMILADSFAHVGWLGALVPFESGYRANTVALGTLAGYVFVTVAALGLARGRLAGSARGARAWRATHVLAYAGWGLAMLHGFTTGSDSSLGWVRVLYLGCLCAVVGALATRLVTIRSRDPRDRFAELTELQGVPS